MGTVRYTVIGGEVIAEKRNGVRKQYVPDPLGSTVALLDNTQAQTDTFAYWPYGEDAGRTGTTPTPFQFVGAVGYHRDASSRIYVRARHYRQVYGRWQTQDPIGFKGGDVNLYRYISNNVPTYTDSSGLLQMGIDYCGKDDKGKSGRPKPKPVGPCPDGGTAVCVTCYGTGAQGDNHIGFPGKCGNRRPHVGDCSIDISCKQCSGGDYISFRDFNGGGQVGQNLPGGGCRVCDSGAGYGGSEGNSCGIDVRVPGPDAGCDKELKKMGFPQGTGWYCKQCYGLPGIYPTGDYPCYQPKKGTI